MNKYARGNTTPNQDLLRVATELIKKQRYRTHFLLPYKDRLIPLHTDDFRYFMVENGVVRGITKENKMFLLDESLDELSDQLDPEVFQRANRQFLVNRDAIRDIESYFNGRLSINLTPPPKEQVLVSKARATRFKNWMVGVFLS